MTALCFPAPVLADSSTPAELIDRAEALSDTDVAPTLIVQALDQIDAERDPELAARAFYQLGSWHDTQADSVEAMLAFRQARELLLNQSPSIWLARVETAIGSLLTTLGEHEQALEHHYHALRLFGDLALPGETVATHNNLGRLYFRMGDLGSSLEQFQRALDLARSNHDRRGESNALNNIGVVMRNQKNPDQAEHFYRQSLAIRQASDDRSGVAGSLNNLAIIAYERDQIANALELHQRAEQIYRALGDRHALARSLHNIAQIHAKLGDPEKAEAMLLESLAINTEIGALHHLTGNHEHLALLYERQGRLDDALVHLRKHIELREQLLSENRQRQVAEMRMLFSIEQHEIEVAMLRQRQHNDRLLRNGLITGALALMIILGLVYSRYRLGVRANVVIAAHAAEVERLARTDSLTGLPNRRHGMEFIDHELGRARRHGRAVTVVLADIDHFKHINDTYGHEAGDQILAEVALRLRERLRGEDLLARWGGEEFLAVLPETDLEGARKVAEAARRLIAESPFDYRGEKLNLSMSFGLTRIEPGERFAQALRRADRALYRSKHSGRNCVRYELAENI